MKKIEVHYFKFQPPKWLLGRIMGEKDAVKGIFTDACAHFWNKQCEMSEEEMIKKLGAKRYKILKDLKYIENTDGVINIPFLDQQFEEVQETKIKQSEGGKAGRKKQLAAQKDSQGEPGVSPGLPQNDSGVGPGNNSYSNSRVKVTVREEPPATSSQAGDIREQWLKDLANSTELENICRDQGLDRNYLITKIPEFKTKLDPSYTNFQALARHFANWVRKVRTEESAASGSRGVGSFKIERKTLK